MIKLKVIFAVAIAAFSHGVGAATFGSWSTGAADDGSNLYAVTINDSGALLGQYCYPGSDTCLWLLGMSLACDKDDSYPVLANSEEGAAQLKVSCQGTYENLHTYVFEEFDSVDRIVRSGKRVGFAFPTKSDQFRIIRFDLNGSARALDIMREGAKRSVKTSTKDLDM